VQGEVTEYLNIWTSWVLEADMSEINVALDLV
jgi:hypothetical protein